MALVEIQYNAQGKQMCSARTSKRDSQRICKSTVIMSSGRCRVHGGATPSGMMSPHIKHGRYSRYLSVSLKEKFKAAIGDPTLLELSSEIALCDVRSNQILERLNESAASPAAWTELKKHLNTFRKAQKTGDRATGIEALNQLDDLISKGSTESAQWDELGRIHERRRRLVESEGRRLHDMGAYMRADEVQLIVHALMESIIQELGRQNNQTARIHRRFQQIISEVKQKQIQEAK